MWIDKIWFRNPAGLLFSLDFHGSANIRVFPKVDHSARSDRIVLVEYTTRSVVELNFCQRFDKVLANYYQTNGKYLSKIWQGFGIIILNKW